MAVTPTAAFTADNRRVLTQEWLAEAIAMWGIAAVIIAVTGVEGGTTTRDRVYRGLAGLLLAFAARTAATRVVWFKNCPVVLSGSAALLLIASTA